MKGRKKKKKVEREPEPPIPCAGCHQPSEGILKVEFDPDSMPAHWGRNEFSFQAPYCRACLHTHVVIAIKMYQPDPAAEGTP